MLAHAVACARYRCWLCSLVGYFPCCLLTLLWLFLPAVQARKLLDAKSIAVYSHHEPSDKLIRTHHAADKDATPAVLSIPASRGLLGTTFESGSFEIVEQANLDVRRSGLELFEGSMLLLPLLEEKQPVGVMQIAECCSKDCFSRLDGYLLDLLGSVLVSKEQSAAAESKIQKLEADLTGECACELPK